MKKSHLVTDRPESRTSLIFACAVPWLAAVAGDREKAPTQMLAFAVHTGKGSAWPKAASKQTLTNADKDVGTFPSAACTVLFPDPW